MSVFTARVRIPVIVTGDARWCALECGDGEYAAQLTERSAEVQQALTTIASDSVSRLARVVWVEAFIDAPTVEVVKGVTR